MPVNSIQVQEYECIRCGYRWINRTNGKNGSFPKRCASCKRFSWNGNQVTAEENGLRRRIRGLNNLYSYKYDLKMRTRINWDPILCERFLNLKPRPTIKEMKQVILSSPIGRTSSAQLQGSRYIPRKPVPGKPGWYMKDYNKYDELIVEEAQKRKEVIMDIIKNR